MKKSAFTLMELIIVIVIIGVLSAVVLPRMERDPLREAAEQVARHLRTAQHYALMEDRFNDAPTGVNWQETLWRIRFMQSGSANCYTVFADRDGGGNADINSGEVAVDPLTQKALYTDSSCSSTSYNTDVLLSKNYGITDLKVCTSNTPRHIAFDHLGRPQQIKNSVPVLLANPCTVTLTHTSGRQARVTVQPETGSIDVAVD